MILIQDAPEFIFNPLQYEINGFIPIRRDLGTFLSSLGGVNTQDTSRRAPAYNDTPEASILNDIAARYPEVRVYDLKTKLCGNSDCSFLSHGSLLYVDSDHLRAQAPRLH